MLFPFSRRQLLRTPRIFHPVRSKCSNAGQRHRDESTNSGQRVFIAIGSNMGDRVNFIRLAVQQMRNFSEIEATSFLYQTAPMYVTNQAPFLNAVAEIRTSLHPPELLASLKSIENQLGRDPSGSRNGPRPIDLDILLYGSEVMQNRNGSLTIPHPRIHERDFVLHPLCDIDESVVVPAQETNVSVTARDLLARLRCNTKSVHAKRMRNRKLESSGAIERILPLRNASRNYLVWDEQPKLMGIVNVTPDSFSDGGRLGGVADALRLVGEFASRGFDIVDIGGQSTRPGALLSEKEIELSRVLPIVEAVRREFPEIGISVDTFRSAVASAAFDAGADIVNDVSAGNLDEDMLDTVMRHNACWIMMHMRGTPESMATPEAQEYANDDVTGISARELSSSIAAAHKVGIPRWDIIVDPGIGFAKNGSQSEQLLIDFPIWKKLMGDYPTLLGISRKSLLTHLLPRLLNEKPTCRDYATAGLAIYAKLTGADIIRVHNPSIADSLEVFHEISRCTTSSA